MILVADGGSTKCDWCLAEPGKAPIHFSTEGYNPYFIDAASMVASLHKQIPGELEKKSVKQVFFYGAGCTPGEKSETVQRALQQVFTGSHIHVQSDLFGAARAMLGETAGFAAILGTGTNTCLYDGRTITMNIASAGYILGDEGSGSHIGKSLLRDYLRGLLPPEIKKNFDEQYGLSAQEILDSIYKKPMPNRFLAGFSKFIHVHLDHSYSQELVRGCFYSFFKNLVTKYPGYETFTFNCIGSIGFHFKDILQEIICEQKMEVGKIIKSPIEELIRFHSS